MIAFKFLRAQGRAIFSGRAWQAPRAGVPGPWIEASDGPLVPCANGIHACAPPDLAFWLAEELWQVELDGEMIDAPQAIVARRGRLVNKVTAWDADAALSLGQACARRAEDAIARAGEAASDTARAYLRESNTLIQRGDGVVAAYAAALAVGTIAPSSGADAAFRAERREQSLLLAQRLALPL